MDMKTVILPKDTVSTTTCFLCSSYLSVPPVVGLCEEGKRYRCGRCKDMECKTYGRNFCYENVAKHLVFPCTYEKCEETIPWGQVEDHEKVCPYKIVSCPLYWVCSKTMQISELECHFEQTHSENTLYKNFVASVKVGFIHVFLLVVNEEQWLFIYISIDKNSHSYVGIFSLSPLLLTHFARYNLKLTSENSSCYLAYTNQNIVTFDERQHCLKCLQKTCHVKHHPYSQYYNRKVDNIHFMTTHLNRISSVLDVLENPQSVKIVIDLIEEEAVLQKKEACEPKEADN